MSFLIYDDDDDTKSIDKLIFIKFYVVWPNNTPQSRNKSPSHTSQSDSY
jgi:hypothetical protein